MARTEQEIYSQIISLLPEWLVNDLTIKLFSGASKVLERVEVYFSETFAQTKAGTANGDYLQNLGTEAGVTRYPWETDLEFSERVKISPLASTIIFIEDELNRVCFSGMEGYSVRVFEPMSIVCDLDMYCDWSPVEPFQNGSKRTLVVHIPFAEVPPQVGFYADHDYCDTDTFVHDDLYNLNRNTFTRAFEVLKKHVPAGVGFKIFMIDNDMDQVDLMPLFGEFNHYV